MHDQFGGAWKYNEIIGYIRLHFLGNQIRGEYWGVKAMCQVRTRRGGEYLIPPFYAPFNIFDKRAPDLPSGILLNRQPLTQKKFYVKILDIFSKTCFSCNARKNQTGCKAGAESHGSP